MNSHSTMDFPPPHRMAGPSAVAATTSPCAVTSGRRGRAATASQRWWSTRSARTPGEGSTKGEDTCTVCTTHSLQWVPLFLPVCFTWVTGSQLSSRPQGLLAVEALFWMMWMAWTSGNPSPPTSTTIQGRSSYRRDLSGKEHNKTCFYAC